MTQDKGKDQNEEASYIDYEVFLDPEFSPTTFANSLVLSTNNATDTPLDLSTPLSRVLFDVQEIDTHIHTLTTRSAVALLTHTREQEGSAERIVKEVGGQTGLVRQGYERLQREVVRKWEVGEEARVAAQKSLETVRLTRAVARCLALGRQLESQLGEVSASTGRGGGGGGGDGTMMPKKEDFRALERAAYTIVNLRKMLSATGEGEEGYGLDGVKAMRSLRDDLVFPAENTVKARAQQAVNRFSISASSGGSTTGPSMPAGYKQVREARTRLVSAVTTLYILSPVREASSSNSSSNNNNNNNYQPELLLSTLQGYVYSSISASLAAVLRGLTMLPTLERSLHEVSARCQDIVGLESILGTVKRPSHPLLQQQRRQQQQEEEEKKEKEEEEEEENKDLLQPLLQSLDSGSVASYFWRSLAWSLTTRVQEMVQRGGATARGLRMNRERLKKELRECVVRGSSSGGGGGGERNWEREATVMVQAVVGVLSR